MAIEVVSVINRSQTIDSVALGAFAKQKRDAATSAIIAASAARTLYYNDLKGDVLPKRTEYAYTPAAADTIALPDDAELVLLKHAATIATLTVSMPANPRDNQVCTISSKSIVTTLTMNATPGGGTLIGALTALTAGGFGSWMYDKSTKIWNRSA